MTDPASPLYRLWQLRVAATERVIEGLPTTSAYIPNRSLIANDRDHPAYRMELNVSFSSRTATATVTYRSTRAVYVIRDRDISNDPPCR